MRSSCKWQVKKTRRVQDSSPGPRSKSVSLPNKKNNANLWIKCWRVSVCVSKCVRYINHNFFVIWLDLIVIVNMTWNVLHIYFLCITFMALDHVHELILLPYDNCVPLVFPFFPLQLDSAAMFKWRKYLGYNPTHP